MAAINQSTSARNKGTARCFAGHRYLERRHALPLPTEEHNDARRHPAAVENRKEEGDGCQGQVATLVADDKGRGRNHPPAQPDIWGGGVIKATAKRHEGDGCLASRPIPPGFSSKDSFSIRHTHTKKIYCGLLMTHVPSAVRRHWKNRRHIAITGR